MRQGLPERGDIGKDLLLDDDAALVMVHVLDGIFDRHDLGPAAAIDQVHQVVERGGLAVAGRAGDEDQAVGQPGELVDHGREPEVLAAADRGLAEPDRHLGHTGVQVNAGAKPTDALPSAARSRAAIPARRSPDASRSSSPSIMVRSVASSSASPSISADLSVDAKGRRETADQVHVAGAELARPFKILSSVQYTRHASGQTELLRFVSVSAADQAA